MLTAVAISLFMSFMGIIQQSGRALHKPKLGKQMNMNNCVKSVLSKLHIPTECSSDKETNVKPPWLKRDATSIYSANVAELFLCFRAGNSCGWRNVLDWAKIWMYH